MTSTLLSLAAVVADRPAAAADGTADSWVFQAYVSLFVPATISGSTTFPPESSSPPGSDDVSASDSLVNLNSAFVGGFSARHGRWGIYTDLVYLDLEGSKTGPGVVQIPGHPVIQTTTTARLGLRDSYGLVAGTYRLVTDPNGPLDFVLGARRFDQHRTLDWQFSGNIGSVPAADLSGSRSVSNSGWDAIAGVAGRLGPTGHGWFAPYYLDVGTGNSRLVWQVNAGVGYGWDWGELVLGWRYMHYDNPRQSIESLGLNGPVFIVLFRW